MSFSDGMSDSSSDEFVFANNKICSEILTKNLLYHGSVADDLDRENRWILNKRNLFSIMI